ncbi:MAG: hypothetical protein GC154_09630 [bacterium]|nr:hypothetical protein [bacterium]
MSRNSRPRGRRGDSRLLRNLLTDKDNEIIKKELDDPEAPRRNTPVLREMLLTNRALRRILYNPFQMLTLTQTLERDLVSRASLSNQQLTNDQFFEQLIESVAPYLNLQGMLDFILAAAKHAKIKREKRVLLWAAAEIAIIISSQHRASESAVVRVVIMASLANAMELAQTASDFLDGKEPFNFSAEKLISDEFGEEDWNRLMQRVELFSQDFFMSISIRAMELFEALKKPFGLPFYRILHYPASIKTAERKLILMPGEEHAPKEEENEEEKMQRLAQSVRGDVDRGYLSRADKDAVKAIKSAAFGEIDFEREPMMLNAAAFSTRFPSEWNPFFLRLYRESGEKAESINPKDEQNAIMDIKTDAKNPARYIRYGEVLFDKQNWAGAYNAYRHAQLLSEQDNPAIIGRLREIESRLLESKPAAASA